jgi:putative phosphoribosyl transferase
VPVAPTDSLAALRSDADEVICLEDHEFFGAIGYYYRNFSQIADDEVIEMLKRFPVSKLEQARQPAI